MSDFESIEKFIKALRDYENHRHETTMKWLEDAEEFFLKDSEVSPT